MIISWYGQTCVRIQNPHINILIDPFGKSAGIRPPRTGGTDILLVSEPSMIPSGDSPAFSVDGPGEYERQGIYIKGICPTSDQKAKKKEDIIPTLYILEAEGVRIAHFNLSSEISDKDIEAFGEVDILFLVVGSGSRFLDGGAASRVVRAIEPKIVIPMGYAIPGLKIKLDKVDGFLKAMGAGKVSPIPKAVLKKKDLAGEETKVIVLKPV